LRCKFCSIK